MKAWTEKKDEHKASVQRRWDNRGSMSKAFKRWKITTTGWESNDKKGKKKTRGRGRRKRGQSYGIKHWGRIKTIPKILTQVQRFLQTGVG
eukprot:267169-Pleurochrysis_carterae.AAC.1